MFAQQEQVESLLAKLKQSKFYNSVLGLYGATSAESSLQLCLDLYNLRKMDASSIDNFLSQLYFRQIVAITLDNLF